LLGSLLCEVCELVVGEPVGEAIPPGVGEPQERSPNLLDAGLNRRVEQVTGLPFAVELAVA